ncbi:MAG: response regulator [Candidatus Moraniibacteriota bacterium]
MQVFIVEDDNMIVGMLSVFLSRLGHEIIFASSPEKAIKILQKMDRYDGVFLTDIGFGGDLNGIDFVRWLRENGIYNQVIILTGYADENKVKICTQELGVTFFISKPVSLDLILEFLNKASKIRERGFHEKMYVEQSADKTIRELFVDGPMESARLYLPNRRRGASDVICISSQNGCNMGCKFCETGISTRTRGYPARNLTEAELWKQVSEQEYPNDRRQKILISIMGMGEPTSNIDNIARFVDGLDSDRYSVAVSTVGILSKLAEFVRRFRGDPRIVEIQISVHIPEDKKRLEIMPATKGSLLEPVLDLVEEFSCYSLNPGCANFSIFQGVNSSQRVTAAMVELLLGRKRIEAKLTKAMRVGSFNPATEERIMQMKGIFDSAKVPCRVLILLGDEIGSACGQMDARIGGRR